MTAQHGGAGWRRPHRHTAVFGRGAGSLAATAVATFEGARAGSDALLLVTDAADPALLDALPDRDALVASGRLRHLSTADAYPSADPAVLLAAFDDLVHGVLAAGWSGVQVVAENTAPVNGADAAFADWLAWEQVTARWQDTNPVVGVCWFDLDVVTSAQVAALASVHADVHADDDADGHGVDAARPFRVLAGDPGVRVLGDVGAADVPLLVRLLDLAPHDGELVVDLAAAGYVHHTVFPALDLLAERVPRVRFVGAGDVLRRVYESVADPAGRVVLG